MNKHRKNLMNRLQRAFNKYIRLKETKDGYGKCVSCGRMLPLSELDAGHFFSKKHLGTRFDERNCHIQCRACNRFQADDAKACYALWMVENLGQETLEELKYKAFTVTKFTDNDLEVLLKLYQSKLKKLREERNNSPV